MNLASLPVSSVATTNTKMKYQQTRVVPGVQVVRQIQGHYKPVRSLAFTPDSKHLLTACDDTQCRLWDVEGGALIDAFSGHESWVLSVVPHPGGVFFASGGSDGSVRLWDVAARACVQVAAEHADQVRILFWGGVGVVSGSFRVLWCFGGCVVVSGSVR